jgi:acetate---CoA ligase (ADP-forming)
VTVATLTLDAVMAPRSVAVVGAGDDPARIPGRALRYLRESGYAGSIYPVNPNRPVVQGLPAFPSIGELPAVPDTVVVAVAAERAVEAVEQAAHAGVKGAVVFSDGFAESGAGGAILQRRIGELVAASGMRVFGPNCLGVFNARERFFATFATALDPGLPSGGPLAIASQSGAYGMHLYWLAERRGLPVGHLLTTGNEVDVDVAEAICWLAAREDVAVVLGYAEGFGDGERFLEAAAVAHEHRTPLVFLKTGRSEAGARAIGSHTAALAGADDVFDAVCERYGVLRATTTEEQLDIAYGCLRGIRPRGRRLGVVTISGGMGVQICDAADRLGLEVPALPADVQTSLRERFPYGSFSNPVDVTGHVLHDWLVLDASLDAILGCDRYDTLVASLTTTPLGREAAARLASSLAEALRRYPGRLGVVSCLAEPDTIRAFEDSGLLVFDDSDRALATVAALARAGEAFARPLPARAHRGEESIAVVSGTEDEAKRLLAGAGLSILPERLAPSADEAVAAAEELGYPVVLKVVSRDVLHKTDVGGVVLDVRDAAGVRSAFGALRGRVHARLPDARIDGVLVARMAPAGVDVIVGSHVDPTFGPVVAFGLGGIFVEALADVALALAPVDAAWAHRMIRSIKGFPLLTGARGAEPCDLDALAEAIVAVSEFAAANAGSIASVDVNPLRAFASGAAALDASVVGA